MAQDQQTTRTPRQGRGKRPGVSIMLRGKGAGRGEWYARWIDPETGKAKTRRLALEGVTNEKEAATWAAAHAKKINKRRAAIEHGAPRYTASDLDAAEAKFLELKPKLRDATKRSYQLGIGYLKEWAKGHGVREPGDLTSDALLRFHGWLAGKDLSAKSINTHLVTVRGFLNKIRALGMTPKLSRDAIADNLPSVDREMALPKFLRGPQVEQLLRAALRHDRALCSMTREDKAAGRKPGESETPKHVPLAPFTATLVLSGMRRSEAAFLRWEQVDLAHGEIVLDTSTKTKRARRIPLDVTPTLAALLAAMKLQAGDAEYVFGDAGYTETMTKRGLARLGKDYGAPAYSWQDLRRTASTYLSSAPGIYRGASAYQAAKRHGHSVTVAEKHYSGQVTVDPAAATLEAALGIEKVMGDLLAHVKCEEVAGDAAAVGA